MQTQTGSCPHCGAPIYAESPWFGVTPPPPIYTCACTAHLRMTYTTTDTTTDAPSKYPHINLPYNENLY